jgi:hypothetical protein
VTWYKWRLRWNSGLSQCWEYFESSTKDDLLEYLYEEYLGETQLEAFRGFEILEEEPPDVLLLTGEPESRGAFSKLELLKARLTGKLTGSYLCQGLVYYGRNMPAPKALEVLTPFLKSTDPEVQKAAWDGIAFHSENLPALQTLCWDWCSRIFSDREVWRTKSERSMRFLEESFELAQACDLPKEDAQKLLDYVYSRPVGERSQELAGTLVTALLLAEFHGINAAKSLEEELARVNTPELMDKIRAKQSMKDAAGIGGTTK